MGYNDGRLSGPPKRLEYWMSTTGVKNYVEAIPLGNGRKLICLS